MRRAAGLLLTLAMLAGVSCTSSSPDPIRIGAVYPLSGAQGPGGVDEFDGVRLAVQLVNTDGGVGGRPVELVPVDTPSADAAPGAIAQLHDDGVRLVFGSYGSTISEPAAEASARRDMLFWETGAVGDVAYRGRPGVRVQRERQQRSGGIVTASRDAHGVTLLSPPTAAAIKNGVTHHERQAADEIPFD